MTSIDRARLADNIVHFVRVLRRAGMPVGPAHAIAALQAVEVVGVLRRDDFRAALACVLVTRYDHLSLFDQAFDLFWRNPKLLERMLLELLPKVFGRTGEASSQTSLPARLAQALAEPFKEPPSQDQAIDLDAALTFSAREVLQSRDFETMTAEELGEVKTAMRKLRLPLPALPTRRTARDPRGRKVDLRSTLKAQTAKGGEALTLQWRATTRRPPALVVLCDISGSMERYSRMLLHFLHAITNDRDRVHTLLFGTRLTNITRHLKHRDVDLALAKVAQAVNDWAGGTRISASLAEFNRSWSRRLLGQGAYVLLITDGLDSDLGDLGDSLSTQMERLAKSCRRLIWLNPLLRYAGFEARPAGIRAMLPFVDDFLPVHNLQSLTELARTLSNTSPRRERQPYMRRAA